MNLKQLETFYWAARLGSFTAAAQRVNSTQSTVSMRIHELEQEFGVDLFDRSQRAARVTARGRELIRYAEQMLSLAAEMRDRISAPDSIPGVVRVGVAEAISVTWLPAFIRTLHERHPKIVLELDEALTEELLGRLREGQLDLILAPGRLPGYGLLTRSLGFVEFGWMASPSLALPTGRLDPQSLQHFSIIALSRHSVHYAKIEDWFRSAGACTPARASAWPRRSRPRGWESRCCRSGITAAGCRTGASGASRSIRRWRRWNSPRPSACPRRSRSSSALPSSRAPPAPSPGRRRPRRRALTFRAARAAAR